MKLFNKLFIVFSMVFLICSCSSSYAQKAYEFELKDTDGNVIKLTDFKGKIVFLDFWASWCPPCRNSIPAIKELHEKYSKNENVVILAINSGEKLSTVQEFAKKQGITYKVLLSDQKTSENYGINSIPAFFIIDKKGNIIKQYKGFYKGLEKEWEKEISSLLK